MSNMQRPRRVGRHIFDQHLFVCTQRGLAKCRIGQCGLDHTLPKHRRQPQIQKSRAGNFGCSHPVIRQQTCRQRIRNHTRVHLSRFCQNHRRIRCHITVRCIARGFHCDSAHRQTVRQSAISDHCVKARDDQATYISKQVHKRRPS